MVKFSWTGAPTGAATGELTVPRPTVGPWDLASDKSFLAFLLIVLTVAYIAVILLSRSTSGRILRATRGSELAAQSIGISPTRARVFAFAVAAGLVSFASPCVLPLVPGFLGYVTGLSDVALVDRRRSRMVLGAALFVTEAPWKSAVVSVALRARATRSW